MKIEELHELLIEYAEGTLPADRKMEAETLLSATPELRHDVEFLQSTFRNLQSDEPGSVPDHYFTNFLPRVREKLEKGVEYSHWSVPQMLQSLFQPAVAVMIVVAMAGLYRSFSPETAPSTIYTLVNEIEQNEISAFINEASPISSSTSENIFVAKLPNELLGIDPSNYQTENEVFALLEDQEAELVVDRIQRTATR